jgi:hypothetical protein
MVRCRVHKSPPPVPTLSFFESSPHILASSFFKFHFNVVFNVLLVHQQVCFLHISCQCLCYVIQLCPRMCLCECVFHVTCLLFVTTRPHWRAIFTHPALVLLKSRELDGGAKTLADESRDTCLWERTLVVFVTLNVFIRPLVCPSASFPTDSHLIKFNVWIC